jgi:hypothetical protein
LRRELRRLGSWVGGSLAAALSLILLAHVAPLRFALDWAAGFGGCPVSLNAGNAESLETYRVKQLARLSGEMIAPKRPGLGFSLGDTPRSQVEKVLERRGASCEDKNGGAVLRCSMRSAEGDERLDAHLQFDVTARLVAVDVWHGVESARDAVKRLVRLEQRLKEEVGVASRLTGALDESSLRQPFARIAREYAFSNYVARLSATHLGQRGIRVREQYQSIPSAALSGKLSLAGDRSEVEP